MARTQLQALEHIKAEYEACRLGAIDIHGSCVYEDGNKHCVVGCLLSIQQILELKDHQALTDPVWNLTHIPGFVDWPDEIGIDYYECGLLQKLHDDEYKLIGEGNKNTDLYKYVTRHIDEIKKNESQKVLK